jgi:hypothetical protein
MTPQQALLRVGRLLAVTAPGSGASEHEARNAALVACRLVLEHRLLDRERRVVDLADVTKLALQVLRLERLLAVERAARAAEREQPSASDRRRRP